MVNSLGPYQKVRITEQTTGRYSILPYTVDKTESGKYLYGKDNFDEQNHFYAEEIDLKGNMNSNLYAESNVNGYKYITIKSKHIMIQKKNNIVTIDWANEKNSFFMES